MKGKKTRRRAGGPLLFSRALRAQERARKGVRASPIGSRERSSELRNEETNRKEKENKKLNDDDNGDDDGAVVVFFFRGPTSSPQRLVS